MPLLSRRSTLALLASCPLLSACASNPPAPTPPPAPPTWTVQGAELTLGASRQFGAAITSLVWNGQQFVDAHDYGRLIQVAYQLNGLGEAYNPTEGGQLGYPLPPNATRILSASVSGKVLTTSVNPAFWHPVNGQATSPDIIGKTVTVDYNGITNLVRQDVTIITAADYTEAVGLNLTGYLTSSFSSLYSLQNGVAVPAQGGQTPSSAFSSNSPVILATADGAHAMGVLCAIGQYVVLMNAFGSGTNDWNAGWRIAQPCPKGTYNSTVYYVVGTLADVTTKLNQIITTS